MAVNFSIPKSGQPKTAQTLAKGFGLPLVQSAIINANVLQQPSDEHQNSSFGTPVYDWIFIEKPVYSIREYDDYFKSYVDKPAVLPNNARQGKESGVYVEGVIIEASRQRNIITTQVSGYDKGSIVEFIGNGDWNITIRGFFQSEYADVYPKDDVIALLAYCNAPVPLKITSTYINTILGINTIVVTQARVFQQQGLRNVQYFEINAISNFPYAITKSNVQA